MGKGKGSELIHYADGVIREREKGVESISFIYYLSNTLLFLKREEKEKRGRSRSAKCQDYSIPS